MCACMHILAILRWGRVDSVFWKDQYTSVGKKRTIPWCTSWHAAILQLIYLDFVILRKYKMLGLWTLAWLSFSGFYCKQLSGWKVFERWTIFSFYREQSDEVKIPVKINVVRCPFKLLCYPFSFHLENFIKLLLPYHFLFKYRFLCTSFLMWIWSFLTAYFIL